MDTETKLFVVCGEHETTLKFRVEANIGGVTIEVEQCPDCKVFNHEEGYEEGHEEGYEEGFNDIDPEEEEQELRNVVEGEFNPNKKMKDQ